jgi:hypothetical protein
MERFAIAGESALTLMEAEIGPHATEANKEARPLPTDENDRLVALCEAPALLWLREPSIARAPEPLGMIA